MKTIEEKAKAYDEALERFKAFKEKYYTKDTVIGDAIFDKTGRMQKDFESIFPPEESEDERVWQWIREHINHDGTNMFDKAVAWLERQKEQKPAEKQDYSGLTDFERAIHRGFLAAGVENVPVTIIKETAQDCLAHLPAEWSEEDEKVYSRLLNQYENLTHCITTADRHQEIREELNFLKSLRPPRKPSEEQMNALEYFIKLWGNSNESLEYTKVFNDVKSLFEQLKKLM